MERVMIGNNARIDSWILSLLPTTEGISVSELHRITGITSPTIVESLEYLRRTGRAHRAGYSACWWRTR